MSPVNKAQKSGAAIAARILLVAEALALIYMCLLFNRILSMKFFGLLVAFCILIIALQILMVTGSRNLRARSIFSIILSIILCAAAVFAIYFMGSFRSSLSKIAAGDPIVEANSVGDVSTDSFYVYLTGMDTRTDDIVSETGNSDVNMVIAVNPSAKKILMVNVPRDYYWYLWGDTNYPDKITHAGNFGIDCSIDTMNSLFGIDINYFVKVGFNSLINIVDAIGGITVYSDYDFELDGAYIHAGENQLDGYSALQFARERMVLPGGDRARGMNQQQVISAIISKMTSPEMLPRFNEILAIIASNTATNMTANDIEKLTKTSIGGESWDIQSIQVDGTGSWEYCYALEDANDVMIPDWNTVEAAKEQLAAVMNGQ